MSAPKPWPFESEACAHRAHTFAEERDGCPMGCTPRCPECGEYVRTDKPSTCLECQGAAKAGGKCLCHPTCTSCDFLVPTLGMQCAFCVATDLADAGHLSLPEHALVMEGMDEAERLATACPMCEGGPCWQEWCLDCQADEEHAERMHQFSHGPGAL